MVVVIVVVLGTCGWQTECTDDLQARTQGDVS